MEHHRLTTLGLAHRGGSSDDDDDASLPDGGEDSSVSSGNSDTDQYDGVKTQKLTQQQRESHREALVAAALERAHHTTRQRLNDKLVEREHEKANAALAAAAVLQPGSGASAATVAQRVKQSQLHVRPHQGPLPPLRTGRGGLKTAASHASALAAKPSFGSKLLRHAHPKTQRQEAHTYLTKELQALIGKPAPRRHDQELLTVDESSVVRAATRLLVVNVRQVLRLVPDTATVPDDAGVRRVCG